ncbi:MAG TPA: tetratricopeptide repeat protein [Herbaspirillum sp.]
MSKKNSVSLESRIHSAIALYDAGKTNKAERILTECIAESPRHFDALRVLGFIAGRQGRYEASAGYLQRALDLRSSFIEGWYYLGKCHEHLKDLEQAVNAFDRAIRLFPDFFEAHHDKGLACFHLQRYDDAIASFRAACSLMPNSSEAWTNLGVVFSEKRNHAGAIECYERVIALSPKNVFALAALGKAYSALSLHQESLRMYERLLAEKPDVELVRGFIFNAKLFLADWSAYESDRQALMAHCRVDPSCISPFVAAAAIDSPELQLRVAERFGAPYRQAAIEQGPRAAAHDKIVIAYLSADYHAHATAVLMMDILKNHDRDKFHIVGISFGPDKFSDTTREIRESFDRFIDVKGKTDHETALLLRDLETDIAVDLKGYTFDSRPGILAYRPAPVQVNYLGYPGTMGVGHIDYLIADKFVIPEADEAFYSEAVVTLPGSYQPNGRNRPVSATAASRQSHGLPESGIVFCSFNSPYKNNPTMFGIWMDLLKRVENSVLWLLSMSAIFDENIRSEAIRRGVDPERIVFAKQTPLPEHLARLPLADIFLDSLPYGAHTTASDALWANVPVVTCVGRAFPGRVGQSVLEALEMPELVAHSLPEYFDLACQLATDEERRGEIRKKIAAKVKTSRLFDAQRYTRELEYAFAEMMKIHKAGGAPAKIAVPDFGA